MECEVMGGKVLRQGRGQGQNSNRSWTLINTNFYRRDAEERKEKAKRWGRHFRK